jgi:hypothetical protein
MPGDGREMARVLDARFTGYAIGPRNTGTPEIPDAPAEQQAGGR